MKRVFKAEIIWDTNDEQVLAVAIDELVKKLNKVDELEAISPHVYPENPIIIIFKSK